MAAFKISVQAPCGTHIVACSDGSSPDPAAYIIAGILLGVAVDVVLVLAEKSYQAVKYFLTQKENK